MQQLSSNDISFYFNRLIFFARKRLKESFCRTLVELVSTNKIFSGAPRDRKFSQSFSQACKATRKDIERFIYFWLLFKMFKDKFIFQRRVKLCPHYCTTSVLQCILERHCLLLYDKSVQGHFVSQGRRCYLADSTFSAK